MRPFEFAQYPQVRDGGMLAFQPMSAPNNATTKCPNCAATTLGTFCSSCGVPLSGSCPSCGGVIIPGAHFCQLCGAPLGKKSATQDAAAPPRTSRDPVPWALAAIAVLSLVTFVVSRQLSSGTQESQFSLTNVPQAPDLSSMTPRDMTDRLYARVLLLRDAGLQDSARVIAEAMAIPAYEMFDSLTSELRYQLARVAEVSGFVDIATAQADTILRDTPGHLLALGLAARLAFSRGDTTQANELNRQLLAAEKSENMTSRAEYTTFRSDLDSALAAARRPRS